MHCDQHVRKMVLEYTQMEITARVLLGELPDTTAYHTPRNSPLQATLPA